MSSKAKISGKMGVELTKPKARPQGYKLYSECNKEEKVAVDRFYETAHPTNYPENKATALWRLKIGRFGENKGKLVAALFAGYLSF
jgi:hypothetical protein